MIGTVADPTTIKVDGEWEWLLATIIVFFVISRTE
jgi:hypothetical protein